MLPGTSHRFPRQHAVLISVLLLSAMTVGPLSGQSDGEPSRSLAPELSFGLEVKTHLRDSEQTRLRAPFEIGGAPVWLATVDPGTSLEISTASLVMDAEWSENLRGRVKIDFIDLYDRNPTSTDDDLDVDEAWLRFGREALPAQLPADPGFYLEVGKFGRFERQNDRHLESYGLVSTAFNRFEDLGVELGIDLGRHAYLKASVTQGNPLFFRDPNALAGDNGTPAAVRGEPDLHGGLAILYDTEVEDLDVDGEPEVSLGLGFRLGDETGIRGSELLLFGSRGELADRVPLTGTVYGGDLDFLLGPNDQVPFPVVGDDREEHGANLWVYWDGFTFFGQVVDQEVAGLGRTGWETELSWRFELPLRWAVAGRQLFPSVAPAIRYSRVDPDFGAPARTPSPSFNWDWEKWDLGVRLGLFERTDLTVEYARNELTLRSGEDVTNDELLVTLGWRFGTAG